MSSSSCMSITLHMEGSTTHYPELLQMIYESVRAEKEYIFLTQKLEHNTNHSDPRNEDKEVHVENGFHKREYGTDSHHFE